MASGLTEPDAPPPPPPPAAQGGIPPVGELLRKSTGILALTIVTALVQFGLTVSLANMLPPSQFGDLVVGMAVLTFGVNIALLGSERSITRFLPAYLRRDDMSAAIGYLKFFLPLILGCGLAAALIAEALHDTGVIGMFLGPEEARAHPYIIALWLVPFLALARLTARLLRGFQLYLFAVAPLQIGAPLFVLLVVLAAHALGLQLAESHVFLLLGVGYLAALLTHLLLVPNRFRSHLRSSGRYEIRTWIALSLPMMLTAVVAGAMFQVDILMLEILSPNEAEVGHFAGAMRVIRPMGLPLAAMLILLTPLLGHIAGAREEMAERRRLFLWASAILLPANALILAAVLIFPDAIVSLLGSDYGSAAPLLVLLGVLEFTISSFGLGVVLLQYGQAQRMVLWLSLAALLANAAGNFLLIPSLGAQGVILSSLVSYGGLALVTTVIAVARFDLLGRRRQSGAA